MPEETREDKRARKIRAGAWLKAERKKRGLSQDTVAERAGLPSQNRISNYENGVYEINAEIARDLAHALEVSEYDTWRGLEIPLPAEVASRRRLITYAFSLMTDKDAEDLYEQVIAYVRARRGGAKAGGAQVKPPRVTRPGGSPALGSQGEESAV